MVSPLEYIVMLKVSLYLIAVHRVLLFSWVCSGWTTSKIKCLCVFASWLFTRILTPCGNEEADESLMPQNLKSFSFWFNLCNIKPGGVMDKLCVFPVDES